MYSLTGSTEDTILSPHHIASPGPVPGGAWDAGARSLTPQKLRFQRKRKEKEGKMGNFLCGVTRAPTAACRKTFGEAVTVTQTGTRRTLEEDGL